MNINRIEKLCCQLPNKAKGGTSTWVFYKNLLVLILKVVPRPSSSNAECYVNLNDLTLSALKTIESFCVSHDFFMIDP